MAGTRSARNAPSKFNPAAVVGHLYGHEFASTPPDVMTQSFVGRERRSCAG